MEPEQNSWKFPCKFQVPCSFGGVHWHLLLRRLEVSRHSELAPSAMLSEAPVEMPQLLVAEVVKTFSPQAWSA